MFFLVFFTLLVVQRAIELVIAKRNEAWMLKQGGYEVGAQHYPYIVLMHVLFFVSLVVEVRLLNWGLSDMWLILLCVFIGAQVVRIWSILSLGKFWNTKILILPQADVKRKGPYQWIKHPNYMVVALELGVIPLIFGAYVTAVVFTVANALMIGLIRIPTEEQALSEVTNYQEAFKR